MGDSARRCSASRSPRSGWRRAGRWPTTTVATLVLPILILAVPILDTTLVTIVRLLEGRPVYQGGRDHSSHRLVSLRALREARRAAAGAHRRRRSAPRASPTTCSTTRSSRSSACSSRSSCSCSSRASSRTSSRVRRAGEPGRSRRPLAAARRGRRRLRADHRRVPRRVPPSGSAGPARSTSATLPR